MIITGTVLDRATNEPVAGATVTVKRASIVLAQAAADSLGRFYLAVSGEPDELLLSAAEYESAKYPVGGSGSVYYLTRRDVVLEPVVVTTKKDKPAGLFLFLLFMVFLIKKR